MQDYKIGRIVAVSADRVIISLVDFHETEGETYGCPDSMVVSVNADFGPCPIMVGQPGSFVSIQIPSGKLLCIVVDIDMRETKLTQREIAEISRENSYLIEKPERLLSAVPVGTMLSGKTFERGTNILPTVNADAYVVTDEEISSVYGSYAKGDFSLGKLSLIPTQDAKINLDFYLSRHSALLGQTGAGKSWAVASVLQKIAKFKQSTTILFDLHGEYHSAFRPEDVDYISAADIELPYWLMNCEELLGLMVDRSESAAPNQVAKFKELLQAAKENTPENKKLSIPKITIDTPVYFSFESIINEFRRLDSEMVEGSRGPKKGDLNGEFTRLLMRIDSRLNDKRYDIIFHPKTYNSSASMEDLFRKLLGKEISKTKKVVVIDISPIPFDVRNSVIALILRCLFDFAYWFKRLKKDAFPIAIYCDEAHIYFTDKDSNALPARVAAERIAKEGRKYGISLNVISQRPRELSSTILSQCNSFMCLRISNPDDQEYVRSLLPDSIKGITNMFSVLRRGECILLGDSVLMPTRIMLDQPDPQPDSDDISFTKHWSVDYVEPGFSEVLQAWRNQQA